MTSLILLCSCVTARPAPIPCDIPKREDYAPTFRGAIEWGWASHTALLNCNTDNGFVNAH